MWIKFNNNFYNTDKIRQIGAREFIDDDLDYIGATIFIDQGEDSSNINIITIKAEQEKIDTIMDDIYSALKHSTKEIVYDLAVILDRECIEYETADYINIGFQHLSDEERKMGCYAEHAINANDLRWEEHDMIRKHYQDKGIDNIIINGKDKIPYVCSCAEQVEPDQRELWIRVPKGVSTVNFCISIANKCECRTKIYDGETGEKFKRAYGLCNMIEEYFDDDAIDQLVEELGKENVAIRIPEPGEDADAVWRRKDLNVPEEQTEEKE